MGWWEQVLALLGLSTPTADGMMYNMPPPLPSKAGVQGAAGVAGPPGSIWYNGSSAPSNAIGVDGDYYYRFTTGDIYFKSGGSW